MDHAYERFLEVVRERALLPDRDAATRAADAVLSALGELLPENVVRLAAQDHPGELAVILGRGPRNASMVAAELYERIARRAGTEVGFAREHALVVCQALLPFWADDTVRLVRSSLPVELTDLAEPVGDVGRPLPRQAGTPEPAHTLASGRPGGVRPVSEAASGLAHEHSVAADNPHGNTKLSSARGISTERDRSTLATGHGGSDRPVSESED